MMNFTAIATMTETMTALALGHIYSGPFLLPRVVDLGYVDKQPAAKGAMIVQPDNPFIKWHAPGLPGVLQIEFSQQLGCLLALKLIGGNKLPYMREQAMKMSKGARPVQPGDTIVCTTKLVQQKRTFFFFEASLLFDDGSPLMETSFNGIAAIHKIR